MFRGEAVRMNLIGRAGLDSVAMAGVDATAPPSLMPHGLEQFAGEDKQEEREQRNRRTLSE
jgi:hypothetical protein